MEPIANFTKDLSEQSEQKTSVDELAQLQCEWYNQLDGNLPYIKCDICKNKGYIAKLNDEKNLTKTECACMKRRRSIKNLEQSGLANLVRRYTFKNFETHEEWQCSLKKKALMFVEKAGSSWIFISGQSGCGKTHICTAICTKLIAEGKIVKYKIWRDLFHELQSNQFSAANYKDIIKELCTIDVLYIDDFLKSNSKGSKFDDELNFAFEIINGRYNGNKTTIISSELLISDIEKYDTALAGRIAEKSGGFITQIQKDDSKNYRLR